MAIEIGLKLYRADGSVVRVGGTRKGAVQTYKHLPDFATLARRGQVWACLDTTTTVALVARPTTTASLTVQNPKNSNTWKVILSILGYTDVVPATLGMVSVWHCVHKLVPVTEYTRDLVLQGTGAGSATPFLGGRSYDGDLIVDRGATVVDDGWVPVGEPIESNIATTNFVSREIPLRVPVILPPGAHYSLQTLATVVTFETALGIVWAEVDKDEIDE